MKNTLRNCMIPACLLFAILGVQSVHPVMAQQTLTQINGWNAYVHLPAGYNSSTATYPTIIFFPGLGEVGTTASKVIAHGPGAYIAQGWNGNVQVDGSTVEFIVISLQPPAAYPVETAINSRIQTIKSMYRVDPNRLYLTGLSHGGWVSSTFVSGDPYGGPYNYASQIAAVVTVQGVKPDDNQPYPTLFDNYANAGGKYLGFEQVNDGRDTRTVVNRMNATVPNSAFFQATTFGNGGHCCWSQFYGGQGTVPVKFNIGSVNQDLYQWMARQRLGGTGTPAPNQAPVANAGINKTLSLPTNSINLQGSGTDADGNIAAYQWTKVSGPAGGNISSASSATTNITALVQGIYVFRLKVTDNKGATSSDDVTVTVNAATTTNTAPVANAGADKSITLPVNSLNLQGSGSDADGTIVSYQWSKVSGPAGGNIGTAASASTNITALIQGIYTYRLKVTDDKGATATNDVNVTIHAASTTNQLPEPYAGPDKSVTLPTNSTSLNGSGTDADGSITAFLWVKMNGPSGGNIANSSVAVTTISNLQEGLYTYRLKITDNAGATTMDDVKITVNPGYVTNQAPVVNAGSDITIALPTASATFNGTASDADGSISTYQWTKISGTAGGSISNTATPTTNITGLQQGTNNYRLTVTDNAGASASDNVIITVQAAPTGPSVGCNTAAPVKHFIAYTSAPGEIYRPNGSNWKGGDTVVITGTNYSVIEFNNISGDSCRPIVIMPQTTLTTNVFRVKGNSAYLKIWGGKTQYGIKVKGSAFAVSMAKHIEADNIEVSGGSIGIYAKQDPVYADPTTWASSGYVMSDLKFSNFYIHDINGEGMYIGHTSPSGETVTKPNGQDTVILPIRLERVEISNNIVERTNWDAIQLSNARGGNKIFNNKIRDYGLLNISSQQAGIILGGNTSGDIYKNEIAAGTGNGLEAFGYGVINIYDNTLDSAGYDGTAEGQHSVYASDYKTTPEQNPKQTINFYNNAVNHPPLRGAIMVTGYANNSYASKVENNTFCIPGAAANWQSKYLLLLVTGSVNSNNVLSCTGSAPNIAPTVVIEADKTITLPLNVTGLNVVVANDEDGNVVSYLWKKIAGPTAGSIVAPTIARTAAINLVEAVYKFEITVTDNAGATVKDTLKVTVLPEPSTKIVRVNMYGTINPLPDTKWNNWSLPIANNTGFLMYENRTLSSIAASIDGDVRIIDNGLNYATGSTVVLPGVLRYNAAGTSNRDLKLTGLNPNKIYDLEFFGSRAKANKGNATVFTLQNLSDTIMTHDNENDFARFVNIVPDDKGNLSIRISRIGVWTYLAGFVIYEKEVDAGRSTVVEASKTVYGEDIVEASSNTVSVYPNPFSGSFKVELTDQEQAVYALILTDISGRNVFYKEVNKNMQTVVENIDVSSLPSGIYFLQIVSKSTGRKTVHKLIKN